MPSRSVQAWKAYAVSSLLFFIVFLLVYPTCNGLFFHGRTPLRLHFAWELRVPFIPSFIWAYLSMFLLWPLQPLVLGPEEIWRLARRLVMATIISGLCFLALPAQLGFPRHLPADPALASIFRGLFRVDQPYNLVPSLHVANSALILFTFMKHASRPWIRGLWAAWLILIAISTMLVHQHHLLDLLIGLALAALIHARSGPSLRQAEQALPQGCEEATR